MSVTKFRSTSAALHLAPLSSSAKADDPVFRAGFVQADFTAYWMPAFAGMTT
jgi:hypothetical protein